MPLCKICRTRLDWSKPPPEFDDLCPRCGWLLAWFLGYFDREASEVAASIGIQTRFIDLSIDSLDYVEWVLEVEQTFGVTISDIEAERCITVGDFLHLLARKTWKAGDPPVESPSPSRVAHPLWDEDLDR